MGMGITLSSLRLDGIANAVQTILGTANYFAPLTSSLALRVGTGSPTFTRATAATVETYDSAGYLMRQALAGEARFVGARRVRNLLLNTEGSFNNGTTWLKDVGGTGVTPVVTDNYGSIAAPDGTFTASRIQLNRGVGAGAFSRVWQGAISVAAGNSASRSIYARTTAGGTQQICFRNGAASTNAQPLVTVTGTWTRLDQLSVAGAATTFELLTFQSVGGDQAVDILVWHPQCEDVTGQSDQTASEYVSVGVLSAPYHGSGVDGVKCFDTDRSGNAIPSSTLLGYYAEGARTNLCLQSQTFGTTWIVAAATVSSDAITAPDGTTTADKIVETVANANHGISQSITVTAAAHTLSVYAKKGERDWLWINHNATGVYKNAYFNIATGAIGTVDAGWTATIQALPNGWYRCSVTFTAAAGTYAFAIYNTTADNGSAAYVGDITKGTYLWGAQLELGSFASSYIPTTTVAMQRNADVLTYTGGDISSLVSLRAAFMRGANVSIAGEIVVLDKTGGITDFAEMVMTSATAVRFSTAAGGVIQSLLTASNAYTPGATGKAAISFATNDVKTEFNGVAQTQDTSATQPSGINALYIGHYQGNSQSFGNHTNVYGWTRNLSQSELGAVTA